jgi:hypothetical protein
MPISINIYTFLLSILCVNQLSAGVVCSGKSDNGKLLKVRVITEGDFDKVSVVEVSILKDEDNVEKKYLIKKEDVAQFYSDCHDKDCKTLMVGISAFANNFYPLKVKYFGGDYVNGRTSSWHESLIQLDNNERKKVTENTMRLWTGVPNQFPTPEEQASDIVCVRLDEGQNKIDSEL